MTGGCGKCGPLYPPPRDARLCAACANEYRAERMYQRALKWAGMTPVHNELPRTWQPIETAGELRGVVHTLALFDDGDRLRQAMRIASMSEEDMRAVRDATREALSIRKADGT